MRQTQVQSAWSNVTKSLEAEGSRKLQQEDSQKAEVVVS